MIKRFEGLHLKPYLCPAGVATVGFGSTYYLDGRPVTLKDPPITKPTAEIMLLELVKTVYLPAVVKLCPSIDNPDRLAALIDFAFNLGSGNLKASTLRKRVNTGDWDAAGIEIMKWTKAGGKVLKGLVRRREAEKALLLKE